MTTMNPLVGGVRKAGSGDAPGVSSALAEAFYDDPVFRWHTPDDSVRAVANRAVFDQFVEVYAPHDDIWTSADGVSGAALWLPHGHALLAPGDEERFVARLVEIDGVRRDRAIGILTLMDEHHPTEPHEYLFAVGVVPAAQGRGLGSALMAPVLERADRAGLPCYLEATSPRNRALYERHGFRASAPISVADSPPMWPMWREPR